LNYFAGNDSSCKVIFMARTKEFDENAVVEKAVLLFWCHGYNGASAQDMVEQLGISRSSLYDTFGDKRSLFIRALQQYRDAMAGSLITMIRQSTDIEQTIQQLLEQVGREAVKDKTGKGCFIVNTTIELAAHDAEIAGIIRQNMIDIENALSAAIKKGQKEGVYSKKHSAAALARFLFNTISGLRVASKTGTDKATYDDIIKVSLAALKH
jgi:TetR/AcrR family transcriptional repressor of nem operon